MAQYVERNDSLLSTISIQLVILLFFFYQQEQVTYFLF